MYLPDRDCFLGRQAIAGRFRVKGKCRLRGADQLWGPPLTTFPSTCTADLKSGGAIGAT